MSKAGWDKYLYPGLSANLHMAKAVLLEPQPRGLSWASRYDGTIRRVWQSNVNDVSTEESILPQRPSMRGQRRTGNLSGDKEECVTRGSPTGGNSYGDRTPIVPKRSG